jgi:hypothetical protein
MPAMGDLVFGILPVSKDRRRWLWDGRTGIDLGQTGSAREAGISERLASGRQVVRRFGRNAHTYSAHAWFELSTGRVWPASCSGRGLRG